jgi:hypothetical protein
VRLHRVDAGCAACDHIVELDLAGLITTGHGDVPLIRLPLRCSACGSTEHTIIVSGRSYGVGEAPDTLP